MVVNLLAVPNISSADPGIAAAVRETFESTGCVVLDQSSDADHGRSVYTLAGDQQSLAAAIALGWEAAAATIDMRVHEGVHPCVGVMDVAPFVHVEPAARGQACAAALTAAGAIGRKGGSVHLYGLLAGGRTRAELRAGGLNGLIARSTGAGPGPYSQAADFGPPVPDPRSGAVLIAARPPLVAFNLRLAADEKLEAARTTADLIREGGAAGLTGVRALAFELEAQDFVQLSFNLEAPDVTGIDDVFAAVVARHRVAAGELIGLAPRSAIARIPDQLDMPGFDPILKSVEGSLRFHGIKS